MTEKTEDRSQISEAFDFEDSELRSTLEEYLREENKNGPNFWNFSTVTGLIMVFIAMTILAQTLFGNTFGLSLGPDLSGFLNILPIVSGLLVGLVGFGFIAAEKNNKNKKKSKLATAMKSTNKDPLDAFLYPETTRERGSHRSKRFSAKSGKKSKYSFSSTKSSDYDSYALTQKKKLFRSRTDKKIAGVCGGLARYFGISSTMVRLIFAIATLFGYGSFILVYIALSIALPREPIDLIDDFSTFKD